MIKNKKILLSSAIAFVIAETVFGYIIHTCRGELVNPVSFASIALACLFCTAFAESSKDYLLTQLALVCTMCADFFLLVTPTMQQLPAMLFFSVTQLSYFLRIYLNDENKTRRAWHISVRALASVGAITVTALVLGSSADAVSLISLFYYANLIVNIIFAFAEFKKHPLLAIGLLLFALCDVIIGFYFIDDYLPIAADSIIYKILGSGINLAWIFYLPAQTLLSISLLPKRLKSK